MIVHGRFLPSLSKGMLKWNSFLRYWCSDHPRVNILALRNTHPTCGVSDTSRFSSCTALMFKVSRFFFGEFYRDSSVTRTRTTLIDRHADMTLNGGIAAPSGSIRSVVQAPCSRAKLQATFNPQPKLVLIYLPPKGWKAQLAWVIVSDNLLKVITRRPSGATIIRTCELQIQKADSLTMHSATANRGSKSASSASPRRFDASPRSCLGLAATVSALLQYYGLGLALVLYLLP